MTLSRKWVAWFAFLVTVGGALIVALDPSVPVPLATAGIIGGAMLQALSDPIARRVPGRGSDARDGI